MRTCIHMCSTFSFHKGRENIVDDYKERQRQAMLNKARAEGKVAPKEEEDTTAPSAGDTDDSPKSSSNNQDLKQEKKKRT